MAHDVRSHQGSRKASSHQGSRKASGAPRASEKGRRTRRARRRQNRTADDSGTRMHHTARRPPRQATLGRRQAARKTPTRMTNPKLRDAVRSAQVRCGGRARGLHCAHLHAVHDRRDPGEQGFKRREATI